MRKRVVITTTPMRLNTGNLVQKLRRMRTELAQMVQQVDDALDRIETEAA